MRPGRAATGRGRDSREVPSIQKADRSDYRPGWAAVMTSLPPTSSFNWDNVPRALLPDPADPAVGVHGKTGTHVDALDLAGFVKRKLTDHKVAGIWGQYMLPEPMRHALTDGYKGPGNAREFAIWALRALVTSVSESAALLWVDAETGRKIGESAENVPEPPKLTDIRLPGGRPAGFVVFDQPLMDGTTVNGQSRPYPYYVTAMSWILGVDESKPEEKLLHVIPWSTPGALITAARLEVEQAEKMGAESMGHRMVGDLGETVSTLGPILPSLPVWTSGDAPRSHGTDEQGQPISWDTGHMRWVRVMTALSAWCDTAIEPEGEYTPKKEEKRARRNKIDPDKIRVVRLRRVGTDDRGQGEPREGEAPEGRSRYLDFRAPVAGHWRQQRCGKGLEDTRTIWVAEHFRGPDDAPIDYSRSRKLFRVDR